MGATGWTRAKGGRAGQASDGRRQIQRTAENSAPPARAGAGVAGEYESNARGGKAWSKLVARRAGNQGH